MAATAIRKGQLILEEKPLLIVSDSCSSSSTIDSLVAALSPASRERFWDLADAHRSGTAKSAAGIIRTNAYPISAAQGGVFPLFARFNHSCTPNVTHAFRDGVRRVHASRDIAEGEELLNSYVDVAQGTRERQAMLSAQFRFVRLLSVLGVLA